MATTYHKAMKEATNATTRHQSDASENARFTRWHHHKKEITNLRLVQIFLEFVHADTTIFLPDLDIWVTEVQILELVSLALKEHLDILDRLVFRAFNIIIQISPMIGSPRSGGVMQSNHLFLSVLTRFLVSITLFHTSEDNLFGF